MMTTEVNGDAPKKPVHVIRIGFLSAAIWKRSNGDNRPSYSVQFSRAYESKEGLKITNLFGHSDLMNISLLAQRAESWIAVQ